MLAIADMIHSRRVKVPGKLSVSAAHFDAALQELRECGPSAVQTMGAC